MRVISQQLWKGSSILHRLDIISCLPTIIGVQSEHADPVFRWRESGEYSPVKVTPSVAQAAMIGDPVSFPKVAKLVSEHFEERFSVVRVSEQEIMDAMITTNRHGHVVCTQGGEAVAGLKKALSGGKVSKKGTIVIDSTSHQLKFGEFQRMYFEDSFPAEYGVVPQPELVNKPVSIKGAAADVARYLDLSPKK